jgi:hypothetical protein
MPSRGVFRGVSSVLFDDPDYQKLPTPARCLLMTLRLCRDAGPAAIFDYSTDKLMRQTGLTAKALESAFRALQAGRWIERDPPIVWVRNGLRYDPLVRLGDPKHKAAILRSIDLLPRRNIVASFCDYYQLPRPSHWVSEDPPKTLPRPSEDSSLRDKGVGSREKGVGTTDLYAVENSEHVESENLRRTWGDLTTLPQPPTRPDVALAPSDSKRPKPPKGHFMDLVASLRHQHPDWPLDQLESAAIQHYYHP